ncbi:MAG: capsular biosynthesis protein [archaeon]|nr:MAG: capsular biosynthesis protein [archaeon]
MKILLVAASGGHVEEILGLCKHLKGHDISFFTFDDRHLKSLKYTQHLTQDPRRNPLKLLKIFFKSLKILSKEKPDVIISTGGQISAIIGVLSKLFKTKLIYIETSSRITSPSQTGKILYPFSDLFIVQWKPLLKVYKKAKYGGLLI